MLMHMQSKEKENDDSNGSDENGDDDEEYCPDTSQREIPYADFAIGESTKCSSGHFQKMRIVLDLAFLRNSRGQPLRCRSSARHGPVRHDYRQ